MPDNNKEETTEVVTKTEETTETTNQTTEPTTTETAQPVLAKEPVIEDDSTLLGKKNVSENYSPMESDRIERKYTDSTAPVVDRVAPEDTTKTPPAGNTQTTTPSSSGAASSTSTEPAKTEIQNQQMASLTPEEQKMASTMLVDGLLGIYRQLNDLGAWATKVSDDQITEWILDEKISEDITVPYGRDNNRVSIREFYQEFNKSVEEAANIPPDYFDGVRESMIREFVRRGWGITDMQNIIQFFARDFVMRASNFYLLRRQNTINTKLMMKMWETQKEILKNQNQPTTSSSDGGDVNADTK